jgi:hypothetical protein
MKIFIRSGLITALCSLFLLAGGVDADKKDGVVKITLSPAK